MALVVCELVETRLKKACILLIINSVSKVYLS